MKVAPALTDRMRDLADAGHPRAAELCLAADELDAATVTHYRGEGGAESAKRMLGCWARARRLWSACSGEPLI